METAIRTGRAMIRAGWVGDGWQYESVRVQRDADGVIRYYHGGNTCSTSDGMVALPDSARDTIVWDSAEDWA